MTDETVHQDPDASWLRRKFNNISASITFRFVLVLAIVVALMIPLFLVQTLVQERSQQLETATQEISNGWGGTGQLVVGPFIVVEAEEETLTGSTTEVREDHRVYMPTLLDLDHETSYEMKSRGIYDVPVFRATVHALAIFPSIEFEDSSRRIERISLVVGITDGRGLNVESILWNGANLSDFYANQTQFGNTLQVDLTEGMLRESAEVKIQLSFRGASTFAVVPVGDTSQITMRSNWPHPKFIGRLPDLSEEVTTEGFDQSWHTSKLARGFSSVESLDNLAPLLQSVGFHDSKLRISSWANSRLSVVGYEVLNRNTDYRDISRAITYGILFVVLTLVSILCLELVNSVKFHIVQYGVVGIGLVLFFLTLLAFTEHIGFLLGYVLAALILTTMNTTYVWFITRNLRVTVTTGVFLAILYAALYFILQLDDYALVAGVALLLLLLGGLMFATKNLQRLESERSTV